MSYEGQIKPYVVDYKVSTNGIFSIKVGKCALTYIGYILPSFSFFFILESKQGICVHHFIVRRAFILYLEHDGNHSVVRSKWLNCKVNRIGD